MRKQEIIGADLYSAYHSPTIALNGMNYNVLKAYSIGTGLGQVIIYFCTYGEFSYNPSTGALHTETDYCYVLCRLVWIL